ncbi:putative aryl-alcohol dehydrogenase aad14 [Podospora conica]|nr:putative aryl-alcohol dehydrogenase aad14 [Schizothecium conicum]
MSLGTAWDGFGEVTKDDAFQTLNSESWLGEWMETQAVRDRYVVGTKYTADYRILRLSLRDSLKKLRTDYIDILYLHWWDYSASIEEFVDSLHLVVQQGNALYLASPTRRGGVSPRPIRTPRQAQGKTQFVIYQGARSTTQRDLERDVVPMAEHFGMAIAPYGAVGSGRYKTGVHIAAKAAESGGSSVFRHSMGQTELEAKMSVVLDKIAGEVGVKSLTAVAIAYVLVKALMYFLLY